MLRQAAGDITASALHVFQPNNPLRGLDNNIAIDYYLGKDADEVKVEFLDAKGTVLRTLHRHAEGHAGRRPAPGGGGGGFGGGAPPRVGTRRG